jgi:hypothetical protein
VLRRSRIEYRTTCQYWLKALARPAAGARPAEQHVSRLCDFSRQHAWATAHNKIKAVKTLENACLQRDNYVSKFS